MKAKQKHISGKVPAFFILAALTCSLFSGCGAEQTKAEEPAVTSAVETVRPEQVEISTDGSGTITLSGDTASVSGSGVSASGSVVTVSSAS